MVGAKCTKMGIIEDLKTKFPRKTFEREGLLGDEFLRQFFGDIT
jgi:hypothetical protein